MQNENNKYEIYDILRRKENDIYDKILASLGFANSRMKVIWTLYAIERPCTQKEVCDDWFENKQTVNSAVKKLVEEGYIELAPSPENFREKLLVFTEKGRLLAHRTVGKLVEAENTAFSKFSEEEQETMIALREKHNKFIEEEFAKIEKEYMKTKGETE